MKTKTDVYQAITLIIVIFTFVIMCPIAWAAVYYVDATNGDDSNTGLLTSTAWRTLAKVNSTKFNQGEQVLFRRGDIWYESLIPNSSGGLGMPIVFGAYGQGNLPIIGVGTERAIDINDKSYLTIENLDLRGNVSCISVGSWSSGIKYGISIRNNKMISAAHGVYINCTLGGYDTVSINNNTITPGRTALWQVGINFVSGVSNFTITNNAIGPAGEDGIMIYKSNNGIISGNTGGGNAENAIDVKNSHDIIISGNTCSDDGEANIVVHEVDDNHIDTTYNIIVENNRCLTGGQGDRMNQGYRVYSGIYVRYAENSIVRYNWVEQAFGSGIFVQDLASKANNNQVYGNIILNCGNGKMASPQGGIELGDCVGTKVYNNTIYNQQGANGHGIYIAGGPNTTGIETKNNIVHTAEGDLIRVLSPAQTNYVSDYNCFYPDGRKFYWGNAYANSFSDWKAISRLDLHSLAINPQLNNTSIGDFRLIKGSPCINQGTNVGLTKDFSGMPIPQGGGPDIGALEFVTPIPPPNFRVQ